MNQDDRLPTITTLAAVAAWRARLSAIMLHHALVCDCHDEWAAELIGYFLRVGTEIIKRWPKVSFGNLESIVARKWDREHK